MDVKDYIIFHSAGNLYWKNRESKYLGCNMNFARIAKLNSPNDIIGLSDKDLFLKSLGSEGVKKLTAVDQHVMENNAEEVCEEVGVSEKGEKAIYLSKKIPLKNEKGDVIGVIGTSIDITKQKASEQAKTEFIRNMEHDIRTPFVGVYGMVDILARQESDLEKKSTLKDIAMCAKELLVYFDGILDFSRIEAGALSILSKSCKLRKLIDSVIIMEKITADYKNLNLTLNYDKHLPEVIITDPYRLKRILINLLSNAIKFTKEGHVKLSVLLDHQEPKSREIVIKFVIEDSGIGIADDKKALIYERFTKLTPSNTGLYMGLGLGLRIVKQFVDELDGDIYLKSKVGEGSTFSVFLPCKIPLSKTTLDEE